MRKIHDHIRFCSGEFADIKITKLKYRVNEALDIYSGLQQPGHPDSEQAAKEEEELVQKMKCELQDALIDILQSFGYTTNTLQELEE